MQDQLSSTFAALADPTRRALLVRLTHGAATVNELAEPFATTLPTISRHLKVLEDAGLIVKERSAQFRACRLEVAPLEVMDNWLDQYRAFFSDRFDRLGEHIAKLQNTGEPK
jgi:DNA-binding transcriptional ArsR family regulator